jgi:hypothetical protein
VRREAPNLAVVAAVILKPDDTDIKKKSNFPYCSNELRFEHGVDN